MSKLESALNRLQKAIDRLEAAVQARKSDGSFDMTGDSQIGVLEEDRLRLKAELERVKAEYDSLADLTGGAEVRLDAAIREIRSVLEH
jgi:hypothetical protein